MRNKGQRQGTISDIPAEWMEALNDKPTAKRMGDKEHAYIKMAREKGHGFAQIGKVIGFSAHAVCDYWHKVN